jgi:hypothetical protein
MSPLLPTRADTWAITLRVQHPANTNMINYGIWDKKSGGQLDSEERVYYPGAMAPPISLGGRITPENVTLQRLYRLGRDHELLQQLIDSVGKSRAEVQQQPLDIHGNAHDFHPIIYQGTLKRVQVPEHDSESNDPAMVEIEITVDAPPAVN